MFMAIAICFGCILTAFVWSLDQWLHKRLGYSRPLDYIIVRDKIWSLVLIYWFLIVTTRWLVLLLGTSLY